LPAWRARDHPEPPRLTASPLIYPTAPPSVADRWWFPFSLAVPEMPEMVSAFCATTRPFLNGR